ncbi:hypothetical protein FA95DRAFT_1485559 [Auriscalpium vulgare]|uniref:Uncharacterized protein n=1 Tax=Auriscalpium vulgare TaxID=40419 RepID=A0ACB8S545_9AGAM|nr:hypothetical protein FA95DRAFT_1485559 [Auriscalpium vulgare]
MKTCRFGKAHYITPGETRKVTQRTVIVSGARPIQLCPYPLVDEELEHICKAAKLHLASSHEDPFATASWIHLILARCHPFEARHRLPDGNGRIARIIASIPLMRHGYPPISIALAQRPVYYDAINQAYDGDYGAFVRCLMDGMREAIVSVRDR